MRRLARDQRFEDAARLRERVRALEEVVGACTELARLRALRVCLLVPALEPGFQRAVFVAAGRVAAVRSLPAGSGRALEVEAGLAAAASASVSLAPDDADELLLVASFLRRPPPELRIVDLAAASIMAA
jgi:UvrB/uvrC motif